MYSCVSDLQPNSYKWCDVEQIIPPQYSNIPNDDAIRRSIANRLYYCFYCSGTAVSDIRQSSYCLDAATLNLDLIGSPYSEELYLDQRVNVHIDEKAGVATRIIDDIITAHEPTNGQHILGEYYRRRVNDRIQPGFTYISSKLRSQKYPDMVRVYFNVIPRYAHTFSRELISYLDDSNIEFVVKLSSDSNLYWRCDNCVLYLVQGKAIHTSKQLEEILFALTSIATSYTKAPHPPLTLKLASGIGVADSPESNSFGKFWSEVIAASIVHSSNDLSKNTLSKYMEKIQEKCLDIEHPYAIKENSFLRQIC